MSRARNRPRACEHARAAVGRPGASRESRVRELPYSDGCPGRDSFADDNGGTSSLSAMQRTTSSCLMSRPLIPVIISLRRRRLLRGKRRRIALRSSIVCDITASISLMNIAHKNRAAGSWSASSPGSTATGDWQRTSRPPSPRPAPSSTSPPACPPSSRPASPPPCPGSPHVESHIVVARGDRAMTGRRAPPPRRSPMARRSMPRRSDGPRWQSATPAGSRRPVRELRIVDQLPRGQSP